MHSPAVSPGDATIPRTPTARVTIRQKGRKVIRPFLARRITVRVSSVIGAYAFVRPALVATASISWALFMPPFGFFFAARSLIATFFAGFFGAHFAIGLSYVCTSPCAGWLTVYAIVPR